MIAMPVMPKPPDPRGDSPRVDRSSVRPFDEALQRAREERPAAEKPGDGAGASNQPGDAGGRDRANASVADQQASRPAGDGARAPEASAESPPSEAIDGGEPGFDETQEAPVQAEMIASAGQQAVEALAAPQPAAQPAASPQGGATEQGDAAGQKPSPQPTSAAQLASGAARASEAAGPVKPAAAAGAEPAGAPKPEHGGAIATPIAAQATAGQDAEAGTRREADTAGGATPRVGPEHPSPEAAPVEGAADPAVSARPMAAGDRGASGPHGAEPQAVSAPSVEARPSPAPATAEAPMQPTAQESPDDDALGRANAARVGRALQNAVQQGGGTVTMRLTPAELGTVRVQMELRGTVVSAQFHTEHDAARHVLTQQLNHLRQALEGQGLSVDRLHVQLMQPTGGQGAPGGGQGNDWTGQDGRSRGFMGHEGQQQRGDGGQRQGRQAFRSFLGERA